MSTNYDFIAEQYKRAKLQPWRAHVEAFTLLGVIGDLAGKKVVDLACGEGFYSRILREHGAASVTGVDLSERMIALARQRRRSTRRESVTWLGTAEICNSTKNTIWSSPLICSTMRGIGKISRRC